MIDMWNDPPRQLRIERGEVHLWKATVDLKAVGEDAYLSLLSPDEKKRAERFRFLKDQANFITARSILRKLLASYLDRKPEDIIFHYSAHQKPYLDQTIPLKFNLSHSHGLILIGITLDDDIGVDIEFNKREVEIEAIAAKFFAAVENDALMKLPVDQRQQAFYNCWTRKEAYIKAKGGGLSMPLDQFVVTLEPNSKAELLKIQWDPKDVKHWCMQAFHYGKDYTGASIVNNPEATFRFYDCDRSSVFNPANRRH